METDRDTNKSRLGDMAKSSLSGSGSDHTRSAMGPSWGISKFKGQTAEKMDACPVVLTSESIKHFYLVYRMNRRGETLKNATHLGGIQAIKRPGG